MKLLNGYQLPFGPNLPGGYICFVGSQPQSIFSVRKKKSLPTSTKFCKQLGKKFKGRLLSSENLFCYLRTESKFLQNKHWIYGQNKSDVSIHVDTKTKVKSVNYGFESQFRKYLSGYFGKYVDIY